MKGEITARAHVRDGRLWIQHRGWFDADVARFEGEDVLVTVRRAGKRQSDAFRGYYWSVVAPACAEYLREMGDGEATPESAHEALAHKFLALGPCPITGSPRRRSTSPDVMPAEEFRAFVEDQVLPFLRVECHLDIPDPDPEKRSPRRRRELQRQDEIASRGAVA